MNKKDTVGVITAAVWAVLLAVLMIRFPVADLLDGLVPLPLDLVLSACFIVIGTASAVLAYCLRFKVLLLLSAIQSVLLLCFALFIGLYLITFNGDMIAYGLYCINPFTALLSVHFVIFLIAFPILLLLPVIAAILFGIRERRQKRAAREQ